MRSSYKNAKIIQPGSRRLHASEFSTPNISSIALHTASAETTRNASSTKLAVDTTFCTGTRLGRPDYSSCVAALHLIPRDERLVTYERHRPDLFPRGHSSPYRILSTDGRCAIDVTVRMGAYTDSISNKDAATAASIIISDCVLGLRSGGVIGDLGLAGQLSVSVSQYDPIGVECLGPGEGAPSESSCADALELVPVDKTWMVFGPPEDASTEVTIPAGFSDAARRCAIVVDTPYGKPDTAVWKQLWDEVVAVYAMCVGRGESGWSRGLGRKRLLFIGMFDPHVGVIAA